MITTISCSTYQGGVKVRRHRHVPVTVLRPPGCRASFEGIAARGLDRARRCRCRDDNRFSAERGRDRFGRRRGVIAGTSRAIGAHQAGFPSRGIPVNRSPANRHFIPTPPSQETCSPTFQVEKLVLLKPVLASWVTCTRFFYFQEIFVPNGSLLILINHIEGFLGSLCMKQAEAFVCTEPAAAR